MGLNEAKLTILFIIRWWIELDVFVCLFWIGMCVIMCMCECVCVSVGPPHDNKLTLPTHLSTIMQVSNVTVSEVTEPYSNFLFRVI